MVSSTEHQLGLGLYTPAEAALYARVPTQLLSRWLFGSSVGQPVLHPQIASSGQKIVTFLDFVQAMAIRAIRLEHRMPLTKIRAAVEKARSDYGVEHPFATRHKTYLYGGELVIRLKGDELVQVSGKHAHNRMITEVVELYMHDLTFDTAGLARAFRAFAWQNLAVSMDPQIRLGEPLVQSCGYTALSLWEAFRVEGSFQAAAVAYGIKPEEVEIACRYFDHLQFRPVA